MALEELFPQKLSIAVVGLSDKTHKPSNEVAQYLQQQGYRVIGINPHLDHWQQQGCYRQLSQCPVVIDIVTVFRQEKFLAEVAADIAQMTTPPQAVVLQLGLTSELLTSAMAKSGIFYRQNICLKIEHQRWKSQNR